MFEVDFDDADFLQGLDAIEIELDSTTRDAMANSIEIVASTARELAPRGETSLLATSIQAVGPAGSFVAGTLEGSVEAGAPYAAAVEDGSRAHVIAPRFRRALRWPVQGGFRFAKRVLHPGTSPQPFMAPALAREAAAILEEFRAAVEFAFRRAGF